MPELSVLLTFCIATLTLTLSPGPSNLYIMACTLGQGAKAGIAAASGMAIGSLIYVALTALGLAAIIVYSPIFFTLLKVAGAAYLVVLGVQSITRASVSVPARGNDKPTRKILKQSLAVELTNPKTALFFLAFLPQFTQAEGADITTQLAILGVLYTILALASDLLVVTLCQRLNSLLTHSPRVAYWQDITAGTVLLGLGLFILINDVVLS